MLAYNTAFTFTNSSESNQLVVCCIVLSNSPSLFLFTSLCHTASQLGVLANNTAFIFTNSGSNPIKVTGQKGFSNTQLFKTKKMNFEQLGIGGLDKHLLRVCFHPALCRSWALNTSRCAQHSLIVVVLEGFRV